MTASTCHPDKPVLARGLCSACYQREWKDGTVFGRPKRTRPQPTLEQKRRSHLKKYGMTPESFEEMLASQGGTCAMCSEPFANETPSIDHDHSCCPGQAQSCGLCVRGLVHRRCNTLLMWADDKTGLLLKAVAYLNRRPDDAHVVENGHPPAARNTVAVDFDATLYPFGDLFGFKEPLTGAVRAMRLLRQNGYRIVIFTSRLSEVWTTEESRSKDEQVEYIRAALSRDGIPYDDITADKRPCLVYFDDRASTVSPERTLLEAVNDFLRAEELKHAA